APHAYRLVRSRSPHDSHGTLEFIHVPAVNEIEPRAAREVVGARQQNGHRVAAQSRPRVARGGAGLEFDLSDLRQRERLPGALRSAVPNEGLVNFAEAQAVVALLEKLAREGVLRDDASGPVAAVTSLYPAQVSLLRALLRQSPALARLASTFTVDEPASLRQR